MFKSVWKYDKNFLLTQGHGLQELFGRFLDSSVTLVKVEDPYIRAHHQVESKFVLCRKFFFCFQIVNFLRLCELCVRYIILKNVHWIWFFSGSALPLLQSGCWQAGALNKGQSRRESLTSWRPALPGGELTWSLSSVTPCMIGRWSLTLVGWSKLEEALISTKPPKERWLLGHLIWSWESASKLQ